MAAGEYKIVELTTDDPVLTHLKKDTKVLECTSLGTIAFQSKQAYGTWEFDVYRDAEIVMCLINDLTIKNNGYSLLFPSTNRIQFRRDTNGVSANILYTDVSYIQSNTQYRIKVTRSTVGEFTIYIKGGTFGNNYVLVDTTGGFGTNPVTDNTYTTSEFTVLDFDAGDQITNIEYRKGIEQ